MSVPPNWCRDWLVLEVGICLKVRTLPPLGPLELFSKLFEDDRWKFGFEDEREMNFYREAAKILDDLETKKQGSLKSLVFNSKTEKTPTNQKRLYALLSETLKGIHPFNPF